ncbi:P-loop containing nucleoside triphosphate hydrolase protein, partial [Podospora didyma]
TAADTKRATDSTVAKAPTGANSTSTDSSLTEPMSKENSTSTDTTSPPLIVHLRDVEKFDELKSVYIAFRDALKAKREEGRSVILIATAVSSSTSYSGTRTYAMDRVWDNLPIRAFTAVNVSPRPTKDVVAALKKFNDQEPLQTTWRHLRRSLRYALAPDLSTADVLSPWADWGDDHPKVDGFKAAMDKWTAEMAHNLARQIGTRARRNEGRIQKEDIFEIMARMSRNKDVLNRWGEDTEEEAAKEEGSEGEKRKSRKEEALDKIRDDCTSDERNYFDCVIDTDAIGATSESIRVDPDVADSLKQLLAIRKGKPYGLLATESVNGAILYGPPGTGKTHLARVLAKEASMNLIVATPADIQDCYVGRTEQKIKAMFSLAVKLAPCLIFLDEGDSLFRRRESGDKAWVRNQLGQFLMEMDGLCKLSTPPFLLIATNRPADIDDAIYRRLPHMLHMGLPNAADRKAIFDIYLKEEQVGDDVDVAALANNSTKGFSGSDVRTLCVQAALAAQREIDLLELQKKLEADGAATGDVEPPKRTIRKVHFDKALARTMPTVTREALLEIQKFTNNQKRARC